MKFLVILLLLFVGCACIKPEDTLKIIKIEAINSKYCRYIIYLPNGLDNLEIVDTCGRYNVGDTVKIVKK